MRIHEKPGGQLGETMENLKKPKRNQANQEKTRRNQGNLRETRRN